MSLHTLANHLQDAGRGDDKILVHMTPKEVGGLEAIARAHGGTLTTNPHTGLPEAGFLDAILPTLAGLALTATGVGAPLAAAMVGGGTAAATGSLEKGLMAGLGAYGGAGLGEGMINAGGTELAKTAAADAATTANTATAANTASTVNAAATSPLQNTLAGNAPVQSTLAGNAPLSNIGAAPDLANPGTMVSPSNIGGGNTVTNVLNETGGGGLPNVAADPSNWEKMKAGFDYGTESWDNAKKVWEQTPKYTGYGLAATGVSALTSMQNDSQSQQSGPPRNKGTIRPYSFSTEQNASAYNPTSSTAERDYFVNPRFTALPTYSAKEGGIMGFAGGGMPPTPGMMQPTYTNPVEQMSNMNAVGANTGYPMANIQTPVYTNAMGQRPVATNVVAPSADAGVDPYSGEVKFATGGIASGYNLGGYSDGGRLLKGPGDGVSDSIPATIGDRQPARLADGEFVVPARIVSELGNGSTEAGARKLYAMMDRIQKNRKKSVGKDKVAVDSKSHKYLPA